MNLDQLKNIFTELLKMFLTTCKLKEDTNNFQAGQKKTQLSQ